MERRAINNNFAHHLSSWQEMKKKERHLRMHKFPPLNTPVWNWCIKAFGPMNIPFGKNAYCTYTYVYLYLIEQWISAKHKTLDSLTLGPRLHSLPPWIPNSILNTWTTTIPSAFRLLQPFSSLGIVVDSFTRRGVQYGIKKGWRD
jgi:hypothetical protein